ncbi:MAG: DUF6784 domain-containing protein [Planctomycetota bacterium]
MCQFVLVIVASIVVSGTVHLSSGYRHDAQLNGWPTSWWGGHVFVWAPESMLRMWPDKSAGSHDGRLLRTGTGAALAILRQWLCLLSPTRPVHPAPLLFVLHWYAFNVWFSVFLGWLAKMLILRYGGWRLYSGAKSFFIGLMMGDIFPVVFWVAVAAILAALGIEYKVVSILPF